jgi:hypothetical protein
MSPGVGWNIGCAIYGSVCFIVKFKIVFGWGCSPSSIYVYGAVT